MMFVTWYVATKALVPVLGVDILDGGDICASDLSSGPGPFNYDGEDIEVVYMWSDDGKWIACMVNVCIEIDAFVIRKDVIYLW